MLAIDMVAPQAMHADRVSKLSLNFGAFRFMTFPTKRVKKQTKDPPRPSGQALCGLQFSYRLKFFLLFCYFHTNFHKKVTISRFFAHGELAVFKKLDGRGPK
jgi:hypothetical protein